MADANSQVHYLEILKQRAVELNVASSKEWHKLLHYKSDLLTNSYTSEVDSPHFFLATDGKINPESELLATLAQFFNKEDYPVTEQPYQCAFIARYQWLHKQLHFDPRLLPSQPCQKFNNWYQKINPQGVTLIFPDAYMNNFSSMLGHTFLRFDQPGQTEKTRLSAYVINFAAHRDESNDGSLFGVKGLIGKVPGRYSVLPYYEKVKSYSDMESRDIWEFQLNFTSEEIERLLWHAWEMNKVHFDYFFLDENCSYHLLSLLDTVRPDLHLTEQFIFRAVPTDTLRAVLKVEGVLNKIVYRPSIQSRMQHHIDLLSPELQQHALKLALPDLPIEPLIRSLSQQEVTMQARILELAYDYLQYRLYAGTIDHVIATQRALDLLTYRSKLPVLKSPDYSVPATRPDQGHKTRRLAFSLGSDDGEGYAELQFRPGYHDIHDNHEGYGSGGHIEAFDITARYNKDKNSLEIQALDIVDIMSLNPRTAFFKPWSFFLYGGLQRQAFIDTEPEHLYLNVEGGIGPTFKLFNSLQISIMSDTALNAHYKLSDKVAFSAGLFAAMRWSPSPKFKLWLASRGRRYFNESNEIYFEHEVVNNFSLSKNTALRLSLRRFGSANNFENDFKLSYLAYF